MAETFPVEDVIKQVRASNKQFFKMGEVGELTDLEPHVLRFWETEFSCLKPRKNRSGHRIFSKDDVEMVLRIKGLLYNDGFTIAGAQKKLADHGQKSVTGKKVTGNQREVLQAIREVEAILLETLKVLDGP